MAKFGIFIEPVQDRLNGPPVWKWEVRPTSSTRTGFGIVEAQGYEDDPKRAELRGRAWAVALSKKKVIVWESEDDEPADAES